jgi:hypothetical protein
MAMLDRWIHHIRRWQMKRPVAGAFRALLLAALGSQRRITDPPLRAPAISTGDPELDPLLLRP